MRQHARWARTYALSLGLLAAAAVPGFAQTPDDPAFAGAAEIRLGDDLQAAMAGLPGEIHQYTFFATAGSKLGATLVTDKGSSLLADVRLTYPGGEILAQGERVSASNVRKTQFPSYTFTTSGYFVLEVVRESGAGGYSLTTDAKRDKRIRGLDSTAATSGAWRFDAPGNTELTVKVRIPRAYQTGEGPVITGLLAPDQEPIHIAPTTNGQRAIASHILLAQSGTYTLQWANPGGAKRLRFAFDLKAFGGGRRDHLFGIPSGTSPTAPDVWGPALAGRDGYVGSAVCGKCHNEAYESWSRTVHHLGSREWQRGGLTGVALVNDSNGNGANDFVDRLDLGALSAFSEFGEDAPVLSWVAGDERPARVTIGAVTYTIERTMGGNGQHQQTYVARIADSLFPMPFEYDEQAATYVPFESDFWYEEGEARYGSASEVGADVSYEARCAGCHATGLFVATDTSGEIVAGYAESDVGCEQCHGPGEQHAGTGNPEFIQNPADVLDGSAAGVAAANATCTRCHDRGQGVDEVPGSGVTPGYPYNAADGPSQYGDDLGDFFVETSEPSAFWGFKPRPVPAVGESGFVAARRRYMQGREIAAGHHAAVAGYSPNCFECHTPHARAQKNMLAPAIDRGVSVDTRLDDNSFCLACHAGHGEFLNVTKTEVQALSDGIVASSIRLSTAIHMADVGMSVQTESYDPTGTGVGRCDTCHMPATAGEGSGAKDPAGYRIGGSRGHEFRNTWPRASVLYGMTNSCNTCHPTREGDPVATIIQEWANPGGDGDMTFHADTPRSFQNGVANAGNSSGGVPCVQCHTTEGFIRIQVQGEDTDQDDWNGMLYTAISHDEGITCRACHGKDSDGNFGNGLEPLRYPKNQLCGQCHNDETVKFDDFERDGEIVRHPQREMLNGDAGEPIPDDPGRYTNTYHSLLPDGCVTCHFDFKAQGAPSHDFQPRTETCGRCHPGLDTFDRPAFGDYDGNGEIQGIQTEVSGLFAVLVDGMLEDPDMRFVNGRFEYGESNDGSMTGASVDQTRAAFNYYSCVGDASRGVHNAARTVELLQRSYESVTGVPVPGADLRE